MLQQNKITNSKDGKVTGLRRKKKAKRKKNQNEEPNEEPNEQN